MTLGDVDLGWWQWEAGDDAGPLGVMYHVHSGERLVHRGVVAPASLGADLAPDLQGAALQRIDYEHPDLSYPLVVAITPDFVRLVLDHNASAALWRAEGGGAEYPAYGPFCRVDDAALEALRIWPSDRRQEDGQGQLISHGGWFNGRWQRGLKRTTFTFSQDVVRWALDTRRAGPVDPAPPPLAPLDAKPEVWSFKQENLPDVKGPLDETRFLTPRQRFRHGLTPEQLEKLPVESSFCEAPGKRLYDASGYAHERALPTFTLQYDRLFQLPISFMRVSDAEAFLAEFDFAQPAWWDQLPPGRHLVDYTLKRHMRSWPGLGPVPDALVSSPLRMLSSMVRHGLRIWRPHPELENRYWGPIRIMDETEEDGQTLLEGLGLSKMVQPLFQECWKDDNYFTSPGDGDGPFRRGHIGDAATIDPMTSRMTWREAAAAQSVFPLSEVLADRYGSFLRGQSERPTELPYLPSEAKPPKALHLCNWHWIGNFYPHLHLRQGDGRDLLQEIYLNVPVVPPPRITEFTQNHMTIEGWDE